MVSSNFAQAETFENLFSAEKLANLTVPAPNVLVLRSGKLKYGGAAASGDLCLPVHHGIGTRRVVRLRQRVLPTSQPNWQYAPKITAYDLTYLFIRLSRSFCTRWFEYIRTQRLKIFWGDCPRKFVGGLRAKGSSHNVIVTHAPTSLKEL